MSHREPYDDDRDSPNARGWMPDDRERLGAVPVGVAPPRRPPPDLSLGERLAAWGGWFGPTRLIATAVCVVSVVAGGYWLVRSPPPPTEATLPSSSSGPAPAATLPPPVTAPGVVAGAGPDVPAAAQQVVVHVAGEVVRPGVYVLSGSPRVHVAIEAAGGAGSGADLDALNMAAVLADGQRLYVPATGEVAPGEVVDLVPAAGHAGGDDPIGAAPIDLNRATAAELDRLPGVGPATAQAIVDDRDANGPFARVDDLDRVAGIGPAKLAVLRELVTV